MPTQSELLEKAKVKRDLALRARRWAMQQISSVERDRLFGHASDLEQEAREMELRAFSGQPEIPPAQAMTTHSVQQVQQQQAIVLPGPDPSKPKG
jgi:hypothetical protein